MDSFAPRLSRTQGLTLSHGLGPRLEGRLNDHQERTLIYLFNNLLVLYLCLQVHRKEEGRIILGHSSFCEWSIIILPP